MAALVVAGVADAFLEAQRFAVVLVVVAHGGEGTVAVALVEGDGATVVRAHFQAHVGAVVVPRGLLGGFQQLLAEADAAGARVDGDGVEAGQRGAFVEQHQGVAEHAAVAPRLPSGWRGRG